MHPFTITDQLIDDTLCTAFEGGITYWAASATPTTWPEGCEYASDALTRGADVAIVDSEEQKTYFLTRARMTKGIREYCKLYKTTPAALDDDPVDASGADVIVQLALFGEVVYA